MRVFSALKLFAIASVASIATTEATDCSSSDLDQLLSVEEQIYASSDCASITSDMSTATAADVCASSCMDFLSGLASAFPDCEYYGVNMRTVLEELLAQCGISPDKGNAAATTATTTGTVVGAATVVTLALIAA